MHGWWTAAEILRRMGLCFTVRATAPAVADLSGNPDSAFANHVSVRVSLSGSPAVADSAALMLTAVPLFAVHNYPNAFRDRTQFILSVPRRGRVSLMVYDRLGTVLKRLISERPFAPGIFTVDWDGTNDGGRRLAPGVYLYMLELVPDKGAPERTISKAVIKH